MSSCIPGHPLPENYPWYEDETQVLAERGIVRHPTGFFDRWSRVCLAMDKTDPEKHYIVKAVKKGSQEALNLRRFHALREIPRNPIVPAELVECENCLLVIMPRLRTFSTAIGILKRRYIFECFATIMEGLEFMHEHNVAFVDIAGQNLVFAPETRTFRSFEIPERKVYYIDFGSSRKMLSGPGNGAVIQDYMKIGGHFPPPEGSDNLDPYAYDIYSLGQTMQTTCRMARWVSDTDVRIGPSLQCFINVLSNSEPARRPSIKVVVHLWRELVHWYSVLDRIAVENVEQRDQLDAIGWKLVSSKVLGSSFSVPHVQRTDHNV